MDLGFKDWGFKDWGFRDWEFRDWGFGDRGSADWDHGIALQRWAGWGKAVGLGASLR